MTTTLFTWGYYGWGNATRQLVEVVDAVERARGFPPPLFVDIRIRRTVRARGFQGDAFEKLLGPDRHRWMKSLGNTFIETRTGPPIQIADPSAASDLLDLALAGADGRRLLFFCGCRLPRCNGETVCHRDTVADLVLQAAKKTGRRVEVIEWPGGLPEQVSLDVAPRMFKALERGRATLPLETSARWDPLRCLPWASIVTVRAAGRSAHVLSGPASWGRGQWRLPAYRRYVDPGIPLAEVQRQAAEDRKSWGLDGRSEPRP